MRWSALAVSSTPPSKRYSASAVAVDQRIVLYGGTQGGTVVSELWVLEVAANGARAAWARPSVEGAPPAGRSSHSACVVHGARKRPTHMVVFGGEGLHGPLADLHVLRLHAAVSTEVGDAIFRATTHAEVREGTEEVTLTQIKQANPLGEPLQLDWVGHASAPALPPPADDDAEPVAARWPAARRSHACTTLYDQSLLVHGGCGHGGYDALADLWRCRLDVSDVASAEWSQPECTGELPPEACGHSLTQVGVRVVLAGGGLPDRVYVLETVTWAWSATAVEEGALARAYHTALPLGRSVLLFGGIDNLTDGELGSAALIRLSADGDGDGAAELVAAEIAQQGGAKPPPPRSHLCGARVGGALVFLGGRGGGHLGGEMVCCAEAADETAKRTAEEEALAAEVEAALKAAKTLLKADEKKAASETKKAADAEKRAQAARAADDDRLAKQASALALKERGEAAAAAIREEQKKKAAKEKADKAEFLANRTGGGFKLQPK
jgi:hypothetical protein